MKAHTLAREEIEGWRVNIDQLMGGSEEDTIQINVLCDMALEALEARIRAFTKPEIAAICELDGCCMLRDKPLPQHYPSSEEKP